MIASFPITADESVTVRLAIVPSGTEVAQEGVIIEKQMPLSGNALPSRIELSSGAYNADLIQAIPIEGSISEVRKTADSGGLVAVVGAKLLPSKDLSDHARFRALESPLIKRHRGKVLLSLSTKPTSDWPFHILELVSFPSIEHYQALMVDPDYAPETPIGNAMATTYTPDLNVVTAKLK
tara:strand:+ start:906 stop:1445 length:540 start_codon:yes stop_codon:yes gene_type:complete